jgi:Fe-S-cluster containining protein
MVYKQCMIPDAPDRPSENGEAAPWARMAVELLTPDGPLRGQVAVYTGRMRLADLVPSAFELTEVIGRRAVAKEEKAGRAVSCRAGCGACCRQMVPVSPPEAFHIGGVLERMDRALRSAALSRSRAIRDRLAKEGLLEAVFDVQVLQAPPLDHTRAVNHRYFHLEMRCPFLIDESCGIHPERPVACRDYNVTSAASWCADPFTHPIALVPMPLPLSVALARLTAELLQEQAVLIPLSLVPFWLVDHAEWGERTWPGLNLFRHFLELAGPPPEGAAGAVEGAPPDGAP